MGKPTFDNGILSLLLARVRDLDFRYHMKE